MLYRIISFVVLITTITSCHKATLHDTVVMSARTIGLIDMFLDETEDVIVKYNDANKQLTVTGNIDKDTYTISICSHNPIYKPYGRYNGKVYHKEYEISFWGDSWNEYFWSSDTVYFVENINTEEWDYIFYDPISWDICLCLNDTTINEDCSNFPDIFSRHTTCIMDSIEKKLRR